MLAAPGISRGGSAAAILQQPCQAVFLETRPTTTMLDPSCLLLGVLPLLGGVPWLPVQWPSLALNQQHLQLYLVAIVSGWR